MDGYKCLIFSDLHLTNKHSKFRYTDSGVSELLVAQEKFVNWVAKKAEEDDEVSGLWFLGDWSDYETLDPILQTYSNRLIKRLISTGKQVVFLEGNHCISDKGNVFTVIGAINEALYDIEDCYFVHQQSSIRLMDNLVVHVFPYISDYAELYNNISSVNESIEDSDDVDIMLFHFPTVNALLDNGLPAQTGVELTYDIVNNFDICLGGDFHQPQKILDDAFYVGAPFSLKFNEKGQRVLTELVISEDGYELNRYDNPFNYDMLSVTEEELPECFENPEQTILKVNGGIKAERRMELESMGFYKLTIPKIRAKQKQVSEDLLIEDDVGDFDLISRYLDEFELSDKEKSKAIEIYKGFISQGD